jgi:hypothetical protein
LRDKAPTPQPSASACGLIAGNACVDGAAAAEANEEVNEEANE